MRTVASTSPSWLSTILFGAVLFLAFFPLAGALLATAFLQPPRDDEHWSVAYQRHEPVIIYGSLSAGVAASVFGGWAWRSPSHVRFHAAFLSGLALLCITFIHVRHSMRYLSAISDVWPPERAGYDYLSLPTLSL